MLAIPALAAPSDLHWSDRFAVRNFLDTWPNTYERVTAGTDGLYTGPFRLDEDGWELLADPESSEVYVTAISGDDFYIAGGLGTDGRGSFVARWAGDHWTTIATKIDAPVRAMVVHDGDLYIGGWFHNVANIPAMGVARWDGEKWNALSDFYLPLISELAFVGDVLYAAGGGWLYRWDGTSWTEVAGANGLILSLYSTGTDLYAGGGFVWVHTLATDEWVKARHVARWDGQQWHALGSGVGNETSGGFFSIGYDTVDAIAEYDGKLVVGGSFASAGALPARSLAQWDGSRWSSFGSGAYHDVESMAVYGGELYIGAWGLRLVDGVAVHDFAKWNGTSWSPINDWGSTIEQPSVLLPHAGAVYAGGAFRVAGGTPAGGIASWDGVAWQEVGGGTDGEVYALAEHDGDLLAGGHFSRAGNTSAANVASWNGSEWKALGDGVPGVIHGLAIDGTNVYACAYDTGIRTSFISKWDGTSWHRIATADAHIGNTAFLDGELYVAGAFYRIDGVAADGFAKFDGSQWHSLGDHFAGEIRNLVVHDGELWVLGWFAYNQSSSIAVWNGESWQSMPSPQYLNDVEFVGDRTIAGGGHLWQQTEQGWTELESMSVTDLASADSQLYVSGWFYGVGNVASREFAALALGDCGNGVLDAGEECDPGIEASGCCDMDDCTIAESGRICRPARGPCDLAERCDGIYTACPQDAIASSEMTCASVSNGCGLWFCDGKGLSCPLYGDWSTGGSCAKCGDVDEDLDVDARDALLSLRGAVGAGGCPFWLCDHDGSGRVTTTDALRILKVAVGVQLAAGCTVRIEKPN